MRALLDTHTLLWFVLDDPQLEDPAKALIVNSENDVLVSAASFWEIAIKISLGKISVQRPFDEFIAACLDVYQFKLLAIEPTYAARVSTLPFPKSHRDPFDRLIASQALVEQTPIVSRDAAFDYYGVTRVW